MSTEIASAAELARADPAARREFPWHVVVFLALARAMRITEVTSVLDLVTARLPGRLRRSANP